jgi:hypothetical protein
VAELGERRAPVGPPGGARRTLNPSERRFAAPAFFFDLSKISRLGEPPTARHEDRRPISAHSASLQ